MAESHHQDTPEPDCQRHQALARSIGLRLYVVPEGRFYLVGGEPGFNRLYRCLVHRRKAADAGSAPNPADLGFPVAWDGELTAHGLKTRGSALAIWQDALDREIRRGKVDPPRNQELDEQARGIFRLKRRLAEIERWRQEIGEGRLPQGMPYFLESHEEQLLTERCAVVDPSGRLSDMARWLARIVLWVSGPLALTRYLDALAPLARSADSWTAEEATKLSCFIPATMAALAACDGGNSPLPARLVESGLNGLDFPCLDRMVRRLCEQSHQPDYDKLLITLQRLPNLPAPYHLGAIRRMLVAGASEDDIAWAQQRDLLGWLDRSYLSPAWARQLLGELARRGIALEPQQLAAFFAAIAGEEEVAVVNRFLRWLRVAPESAFTPRLARLAAAALTDLVVPAVTKLRCHDLLLAWASVSRRSRRYDGDVPAAASDLRIWLGRIGYYQRLAGGVPAIPKSLRKQIELPDRLLRERAYLKRAVGRSGSETARQARLRWLESRGRQEDHASAAKLLHSAQKAFLTIALESLRQVIHRAAERTWREKAGIPPPEVSPARFLDFVTWIHEMDDGQRQLLREIHAAWQQHGLPYKRHLAANQAWLAKADSHGLDVQSWLTTPAMEELVDGQPVRIEVAGNPTEILLMGTYFGTCLSLGDVNQMSVLANAYHANKQVVYVRDRRGKPLGRKLVAVSQDFRLLGYHCYVHEDGTSDKLREAINVATAVYCSRWARRCGLELADGGTPEAIADHFWYDDDPCPWHRAAAQARAERYGVIAVSCGWWQ